MSFLGDIVSSIGGEKAPAPPIRPPSRPSSTKPQAVASNAAHITPVAKLEYKGTAGTLSSHQSNGLKRKAEDSSSNEPNKINRPISKISGTIATGGKPSSSEANLLNTKAANGPSSTFSPVIPSTPATPGKPPTKGSYAEMLAKAKQAQQQKVPSQVGMIKHQATEKLKTSKVLERKREEQDKSKTEKSKLPAKSGKNSKPEPRRRSASPSKISEQQKMLKAPKPPLHGPAPQYKGTMGTAPRRPRDDRDKRNRRYDEYLGTDEEDEGDDDGYGGGEDYYSDESSDMEGGFDEVEAEERKALREAQMDDARELAIEQRLKKDKLDRKQKLQAMASRRK